MRDLIGPYVVPHPHFSPVSSFPSIVLSALNFSHQVDPIECVHRFRWSQDVLSVNFAGLLPLVTWPGHE